jgi:glycosyltransferase involved in cell wall biosynthesis
VNLVIDAANIDAGGAFKQLVSFARFAAESETNVELHCANSSGYVEALHDTTVKIKLLSWLNRAKEIDVSVDPSLGSFARVARLGLVSYWRGRRLPQILRDERADVLFNPNAILPRRRIRSCAYVVMSQNALPFDDVARNLFCSVSDRTKLALIRRSQIRALSQADGVAFISSYAARNISAQVPALCGTKTINYLGVDDAIFYPLHHDPSSQRELKIIYVSDLLPYKHHAEVLTALSEIRRLYAGKFRLDLVGGDWKGTKRKLTTQAKMLGVQDYVRFHGRVSEATVAILLRESDIGLFATSCENCPTTLIEKMKSGLAIASSNVGPMPEILGNAGLYFNPRSPAEIATALQRLLDDTQLRVRMRAAAIVRARDFSVAKHNAALLAFMHQVAAASRNTG